LGGFRLLWQAHTPKRAGGKRRGGGGGIVRTAHAVHECGMAGNLSLLSKSRFLPLFATQMLGAINDNLFKNALVVLALYRLSAGGPIVVALSGGVFILPYALFSAPAGQLADTREKSRLILLTKFWELALMLLASAGFLSGSITLLMAVLFGLGMQAAFFGPLKYGILPDHLREDELIAGNGLIEAGTFVGILMGTVAGGALIVLRAGPLVVSLAGVGVAVAGIVTARFVPPAPPVVRDLKFEWNILRETGILIREAKKNRPVWLSLLGISWFWTVGSVLLAEFPTIARVTLGAGGHVVTLMLASFSIGVGLGSIFCARLLRGEVSARLLPWASIGISIFTADFAFAAMSAGALHNVSGMLGDWQGRRMLLDLLLLSACGGCYSVPLYAICQERSAPSHRSRMIAANNVLNALAMTAGAVTTAGLYAIWPSSPGILLVTAVANLAVTLWIFHILPLFRNAAESIQH
jgi:acyl-[acyl-carrier-protein]-phospholipid O-acyltransferase / long-chain-fatty-acid--[acyl-carrier-protein] ligase